jgi:hypothetical protein
MIGDHLSNPGAARQSEEGVHLAAILAPRNRAAGRERAKPVASGLGTRGRPHAAREQAGDHQDPENARLIRHEF